MSQLAWGSQASLLKLEKRTAEEKLKKEPRRRPMTLHCRVQLRGSRPGFTSRAAARVAAARAA